MAEHIAMNPTLREKCKQSVQNLMSHNYAAPFLQPVDPIAFGIPDYFEVIKQPMDLGTIMKRFKDPKTVYYKTFEDFCADVRLIFTNCLTYNNTPADELIRTMAMTLSKQFDKFVTDVYSNPAKYGIVPEGKGRGRGKPAAKRPRPEDSAEGVTTTESHIGDDSNNIEGEDGDGSKRRRKMEEYTPMSQKMAPGSPEHAFWTAVEWSWDDIGIGGGTRRIAVMGRAIVDLYVLYNLAMKFGGYDIINGMKGGWTTLYRELTGCSVVEGSAASRIKKLYERMLLEYERRIAAGWTPEAPRPYPVLTNKETFQDAGRGIPRTIAEAKAEAIELLASKTGTTPFIIADPSPDDLEAGGKSASQTAGQASASVAQVPVVKELRRPRLTYCTHNNSIFGTSATLGAGPRPARSGDLPPVRYLALSPLLAANMSVSLSAFSEQLREIVRRKKATQAATTNDVTESGGMLSMHAILAGKEFGEIKDAETAAAHLAEATGLSEEFLDFTSWLRGRSERVCRGTADSDDEDSDDAVGRTRNHDRMCCTCGATRKLRKATPTETGSPPASESAEDAPAAREVEADGSAEKGDETDSEAAEDESDDVVVSRRGRKAAPFRAWALCSSCTAVECFNCVFPTPQSCGCVDEAARSEFLLAAGKTSAEVGSCSLQSQKAALSDIPVWFCKKCKLSRRPTLAGLPWCAQCAASLGGPPSTFEDSSFFNVPTTAKDYEWPKVARCMCCKMGYHADCANRAGVVVLKKAGTIGEPDEDDFDDDKFVCWHCWRKNDCSIDKVLSSAQEVPRVFLWNESTKEIMVRKSVDVR